MTPSTLRILIVSLGIGGVVACALVLSLGVAAIAALGTTLATVERALAVSEPASTAPTLTAAPESRVPSAPMRAQTKADVSATEAAVVRALHTDTALRSALEAYPDLEALADDPDPAVRNAMRSFFDQQNPGAP